MEDFRAITRASFAATISPATRGRTFRNVALTCTLCCLTVGLGGCKGEQLGPSGAEVYGAIIGAGAAIAVGTIVAVEVHKGHHTVKGCVSSGQNGLELQSPTDKKTYALSGDTANIKVGDLVRLHGNKLKKDKHSTGERTFSVTQIRKDYGPCQASVGPSGKTTTP